jgi:hypothetical protein
LKAQGFNAGSATPLLTSQGNLQSSGTAAHLSLEPYAVYIGQVAK